MKYLRRRTAFKMFGSCLETLSRAADVLTFEMEDCCQAGGRVYFHLMATRCQTDTVTDCRNSTADCTVDKMNTRLKVKEEQETLL